MKANSRILLLAALFILASTGSHAAPVGLPLTTFTAGTTAKASEINGNFSVLKTSVEGDEARIGALEAKVTPDGNVVLVPLRRPRGTS